MGVPAESCYSARPERTHDVPGAIVGQSRTASAGASRLCVGGSSHSMPRHDAVAGSTRVVLSVATPIPDTDSGDNHLETAIQACVAWGYINPAISLSEARTILESCGSIACNARSLRVVATLLLSMPSGRALLLPALAGEFCAEIAAFLLQVRLQRDKFKALSCFLLLQCPRVPA
jgi:hypothetical protein